MKIFISHSKKDRAVAVEVAEWLKKNGQEVWFDEDKIRGGDSLISEISKGLVDTECLILLNSQNSYVSKWVNHEIEQFLTLAIQQDKKTIVLQLEDCPMPAFLEHLKYIDFSDHVRGLYELSEALRIPHLPRNLEATTNQLHSNLINMFVDNSLTCRRLYEQLKEGVELGAIDQKFLYWNVDSSKLWVDLCHNSDYPLYTSSIQLLLSKFGSEIYPKIVSLSGHAKTFVNIGVGSGQKDYLILKEMIKKCSVKYYALDLSYSMIQETLTHILPLRDKYPSHLTIQSIIGDLNRLGKYKEVFSSPDPIMYGFLGSNISNFNENRTLSLLREIMKPTDTLLLEVDWIGDRSNDEILKGYSDEENMRFIWQPLAFLGYEKRDNWAKNFQFVCSSIGSDIPNSLTLNSSYNLQGKNVILAKSSKYNKLSFLSHVQNHVGFDVIGEFSNNPHFGVVALKKQPTSS